MAKKAFGAVKGSPISAKRPHGQKNTIKGSSGKAVKSNLKK